MTLKFVTAHRLDALLNSESELGNGTFAFCDETDRLYIKMHNELIGVTPARREIKELKCKSCGGHLPIPESMTSIVKCPYCGSVYDIDSWNNDI